MDWPQVVKTREFLATERGAVVRDWGGRLPIVLAYPNDYSVGMSSLAVHTLYHWLNALPGVVCERAFAWLDRPLPPKAPLLTFETQRPVREAGVLAFSVPFEMDYLNLVAMLQRASIPVRAEEREEGDPFVILGGPAVSANPLPLAPIADAIVIGEAEPILKALVGVLREAWARRRMEVLEDLASLPGVYVGALHDGHRPVERLWLRNLDAFPTCTRIIAPRAEFGDMYLVEISRGCIRGCRFCLAGHWYRPMRERSLENIVEQAREGLRHLPKIGLVGAAVSDYSQVEPLVARLREMGAMISVSSLRVYPLPMSLLDALAESGSRSLTLAPEAGSERLRRAIRKGVSHGHILRAAEAARGRFASLKLYFMIGLPDEEDEDIEAILQLVGEVRNLFEREVVVNVTPFVPKAHTPYERAAMAPVEVLEARIARLREGCRALHAVFRAEGVGEARLQGTFARGDRRLGEVLASLKTPTTRALLQAMAHAGLEMEEYLQARPEEVPLPWSFIALDSPGRNTVEAG